MNAQERYDLCKRLAEKITDEAPIEALMQFFFEDQVEVLEDLSDEELLEKAAEIT